MLHFQASKKSVFLVCKSPEAIKCFSLCLDFLCVLADKLMEETEELCLQREQKEVSWSRANFLQLPCGRAGRLGLVGLKALNLAVFRERGLWRNKSLQPTSGSWGWREEWELCHEMGHGGVSLLPFPVTFHAVGLPLWLQEDKGGRSNEIHTHWIELHKCYLADSRRLWQLRPVSTV